MSLGSAVGPGLRGGGAGGGRAYFLCRKGLGTPRRRQTMQVAVNEAGERAFSPVREYHDICMTFCGITMTRFGAMTRNHDIASQTPPWGP